MKNIAVILFIFIIKFSLCFAQDDILKLNLKDSSFRIYANKVKYDNKQNIIEAFEDVYLESKDYKIKANYAKYNKDKKVIYLKGDVSANWNENSISGKEIEVYVTNSTGWIKAGEIFYSIPHFYFRGELIEKTGNRTFAFKETEVTSCDSKVPEWSLWIKEGTIEEDGDARLRHVFFEIKKHKVAYVPYLQLPVLVKRKSGFLLPEYVSSSRDGTGGILPYYFVISKEQDITLYSGYLTKRGVLGGIEYRFVPNLKTKGLVLVSYLNDKITYDTEDSTPSSYSQDGFIRPNKKRYWIRGKINSYFFDPDIDVKIDVDYVSDQDYLKEFDSGYLGYDLSLENFKNNFGRDILEKDSYLRENSITLSKNLDVGTLYLQAIYREDVRYKNHNLDPTKDTTVQTLPQMGFDFDKKSLLNGAFDFEAHSDVSYFYRRYSTKGTRIDLYPTISKSLDTNYGTFIPSLSFRNTSYFLDEPSKKNMDYFENRFFTEVNLDYSTQLYRIFTIKENNMAIRHLVIPEVNYFHRFLKTREDLPNFDVVDTFSREEYIQYSLDNIFTLKWINDKDEIEYKDVVKVKFSQKYDITESGRERDLDKYPKRPFSDIRTEYVITPSNKISLSGNLWLSPYIKGITEWESRVEIRPIHKLMAYLSYDYQRELNDDIHRIGQTKLSTIRYGGTYVPNKRWEIAFSNERDLVNDEVIKTWARIQYKHQCWSIASEFEHTSDDDRIVIYISLGSLGEVNQGFSLQ